MSLYALAIHTSSPDLGLMISDFEGNQRSSVQNLGRELSSSLHVHLTEFLKPQSWQDLAFLAVAIGPGGFTGTRIGVVAARTLAQQLEIPLFGVSSLAAIALQSGYRGTIAVQMPAQRGELYTAIYQRDETLKVMQPDAVMTAPEWEQIKQSIDFRVEAEPHQGRYVEGISEIALINWKKGERPHWSEALPYYGQHPVETKLN
ncbi:tRNA (adenosine(37)-N6)-threonylcarbamoyltransferase complex dimerization subunit type 1 TsaB [Leptolyngbya sp. FACHB-17]|uniref:tRNA (adenosine(37)-N6)-threonylcarbamoyltransferase complex dimerization subunit type 1 TsaB n=1 Tax=unclassified Leptolyngbya TaxID=2650499 RepID=UPI00168169FB|nr:tRNA (adenosine(37)-N6)-threonylcarbamoyltransferase complex dimerization subunit type 1 TsaB [Leptolyngbya sp. FACHB-17]MBD2079118.1 tRNA (adenosine(37)-N6)-threonylcarbamoyltransferase complex dimerization subunit type 1 TsaB [Leptolyngbya sp. FACHB-17]